MNITKEKIYNEKKNVSLSGQYTLESDLILPDYYGNINKVLKCTVSPVCEATAYSDNKLSVSGVAKISLLFSDEEFCIYNYETEIKYTKIFQTDKINDYDCFNVNQTVQSLNYRVSGPKHLDINSSLQINVKIYGLIESEYINDADDKYLSVKKERINCFQPSAVIKRDFVSDCDFPLEHGKKVKCIIHRQGKLRTDEIKVIKDKTYIKGQCDARITYFSSDNKIEIIEKTIPFTEVIDTYNSNENDKLYFINKNCEINTCVKEGSSENSVIGLSCCISLILKTGNFSELDIVSDAYSTKNITTLESMETEYIKEMHFTEYSSEIIYETESISSESFEICDVFADEINVLIENNADGKLLLISSSINALVKRNDNSYSLISRKITKQETIDDVSELLEITDCDVLSVNALQISGGRIKFAANIRTEICQSEICKVNILTSINKSDNLSEDKSSGIILYFAEPNEEVWQIAKENKADINEIKAFNSFENDVIETRKLLIFSDL